MAVGAGNKLKVSWNRNGSSYQKPSQSTVVRNIVYMACWSRAAVLGCCHSRLRTD